MSRKRIILGLLVAVSAITRSIVAEPVNGSALTRLSEEADRTAEFQREQVIKAAVLLVRAEEESSKANNAAAVELANKAAERRAVAESAQKTTLATKAGIDAILAASIVA